MQEEIFTVETSEWQEIQDELNRLREENAELKAKLGSKNQELIVPIRSRHSMTQSTILVPEAEEDGEKKEMKSSFKNEMEEWSLKIGCKYLSKFGVNSDFINEMDEEEENCNEENMKNKSDQNEVEKGKEGNLQKCISKQISNFSALSANKSSLSINKKDSKTKQKIPSEMKLIESICLYGPNDSEIVEGLNERKIFVKNKMIYCSKEDESSESFGMYGEYFYSDGLVTARDIKVDEAPTQVNQIIFRKNTKKEDCNLFLFRGEEDNESLNKERPVLSKTNPGKWLFAFFVQFPDYEMFEIEDKSALIQQKLNKSAEQNINNREDTIFETNLQESDRGTTSVKIKTHYVKSNYTLCIFTYFPFINLMEQLLACMLDETKIKRVERYAESGELKDVTIRFLTRELREEISEIEKQFRHIPMEFGSKFQLTLGNNFCLEFSLEEEKLNEIMFSGWVHDLMKLFERDMLYEIFINIMTEESVCFVCENMHILSYVIFFFVCILPLPFTYPYPCISQVFSYELLESPFVVTAGINQPTKWLEENYMYFGKKIFVDLNDEVKVKGKGKLHNIKSDKLKKIFSQAYKKIENNISPLPQLFKKKTTIIRPATKEENESAICFLTSLQTYFTDEIFNHLPNPAIITYLKDKIEEANETSKIFYLLKEIEKYLKESRKQKDKDNFIELLIQQQVFYVHMGTKYDLN